MDLLPEDVAIKLAENFVNIYNKDRYDYKSLQQYYYLRNRCESYYDQIMSYVDMCYSRDILYVFKPPQYCENQIELKE